MTKTDSLDAAPHPIALSSGEPAQATALSAQALAEEMALLDGGTGIFRWEDAGVILLRGAQAAEFLSGITTNHVQALAVGALQHQLICANKGKILFEVALVRTKPDAFLLLTAPGESQAVAGHVEFYHVREEFELGEIGFARIDLIGRGAAHLLESQGISACSTAQHFGEGPLVTVPDPLWTPPRIVALLPATHAQAFIERLAAAGKAARPIGAEAYEEARIWAGVPLAGQDFTQDFLPAEATLYTHLSFNKGCYVGQEIHARMHHRGHPNRKLVALDLPDAAGEGLAPRQALFQAGEAAGHITSLSRLPREGRRRAIALVRYAAAQSQAPLSLEAEGAAVARMLPLSTDLGAVRA